MGISEVPVYCSSSSGRGRAGSTNCQLTNHACLAVNLAAVHPPCHPPTCHVRPCLEEGPHQLEAQGGDAHTVIVWVGVQHLLVGVKGGRM